MEIHLFDTEQQAIAYAKLRGVKLVISSPAPTEPQPAVVFYEEPHLWGYLAETDYAINYASGELDEVQLYDHRDI